MSFFLENCFGCLRLRTGVLIIGYLHLIAVVVLLIMQLIMAISFYISFGGQARDDIVNLLSFVVSFLLSYISMVVLLIYGATKGNRHCMLPFVAVITFESSYVVLYEVLCCICLVSKLLSLGVAMIYVAFNVFVLWVVLSHHQELKKYTLESREDDEVSIVETSSA